MTSVAYESPTLPSSKTQKAYIKRHMACNFTCQSKRSFLLQLPDMLPSLYTPSELSFASNNLLILRFYLIWDWLTFIPTLPSDFLR